MILVAATSEDRHRAESHLQGDGAELRRRFVELQTARDLESLIDSARRDDARVVLVVSSSLMRLLPSTLALDQALSARAHGRAIFCPLVLGGGERPATEVVGLARMRGGVVVGEGTLTPASLAARIVEFWKTPTISLTAIDGDVPGVISFVANLLGLLS